MAFEQYLIILKNELDNDPLARGYAGMTDSQAANSLNDENITIVRDFISGQEVFQALDVTEFQALTVANKSTVLEITHRDEINTANSNERNFLLDIFGGGSTTVSNLQSVRNQNISRAFQIGIPVTIKPGYVNRARSIT